MRTSIFAACLALLLAAGTCKGQPARIFLAAEKETTIKLFGTVDGAFQPFHHALREFTLTPGSESAAIIASLERQRKGRATEHARDDGEIRYVTDEIETLAEIVSLPGLCGRYCLIDLWASWCIPCRQQFRFTEQLHEITARYDSLQLVYISIDKPETADRWTKAVEKHALAGWHIRAGQSLLEDITEDVREVWEETMKNSDGTEYTTHLVNGLICQAQLTKISPNGKWIASSYRTETPAEDRLSIVTTQTAAFYNTETETTTIVSDYGESVGVHVTDDGIGFIGIGTLGISSGAVYDLNTGTDLGSTQDWVYDNYGIIIPAGYINYVSADGRFVLGTKAESSAGGVNFINWYIAPPVAK